MRTRWWGVVAVAGLVALGGCGNGGDDAQVHAGSSTDVAGTLSSSIETTLARPYGVTGELVFVDDDGEPVEVRPNGPMASCLADPGLGGGRLQVDPVDQVVVFEDTGSAAVVAVVDRRARVAYLPRDRFAEPAIVTAPWIRLGLDDPNVASAALSIFGFGLPFLSSLDLATPDSTLNMIPGATASVVDVGREDVDGAPTTRLAVTLDGDRYDAANEEQRRTLILSSPIPGMPVTPGTEAVTSPATATPLDEVPSIDAWINNDGTLRRITLSGAISDRYAPTDATSNRKATRAAMTYDFRAVGQPLSTGRPPAADVADLGTQPAAVLRPRPECDSFASGTAGSGVPTPPDVEAWQACIRANRDEAFAGKTVDEYLRDGGTPYGMVAGGSGNVGDVPVLQGCPFPVGTNLPLPGQDQPVLSVVPGTIPPP